MDVKFRWFRAQNFLGWKNLNFKLPEKGCVFVRGKNEVGKSSIIEVPAWVITAETLRGETPDRILRDNAAQCWAEIGGVFGTEPKIVRRTRTRAGNETVTITDRTGKRTFKKNAARQELLDLFGLTPDVLASSLIYTRGFKFMDASPESRMEVLRPILELGQYKSAAQDASKLASTVRNELQSLLDKKQMAEVEVSATVRRLEERRVALGNWEQRAKEEISSAHKAHRAQVEEHILNAAAHEALKATVAKKLEANTAQLAQQEAWLAKAEPAMAKVDADAQALRIRAESLSGQAAVLEAFLQDTFERAMPGESGCCPLCGGALDDVAVTGVAAALQARVSRLVASASVLGRQAAEKLDGLRAFRNKNHAKFSTQTLKTESVVLQRKLHELDRQMRSEQEAADQLEATPPDTSLALTAVAAAQADFNEALRDMAVRREQVQELENQVATTRARLEKVEVWISGFSEVQDQITEEVVPILNEAAAEAAADMADGMHVEFSSIKASKKGTAKDEFNVTAWIDGKAKSRKGFSGAQGQKADLIAFSCLGQLNALRQGKRYRFMAFDEAFDVCDAETQALVAEYLLRLGQSNLVMVVSHSEALRAYFENQYTVILGHDGAPVLVPPGTTQAEAA